MGILRNAKKESTSTSTPSKKKDRASIFINNTEGVLLGFLNLNPRFEESAFEKTNTFIIDNPDSFTYSEVTNSVGQSIYIKSAEGEHNIGFYNPLKPSLYNELVKAISDGLFTLSVAQPVVNSSNVDEFLATLRPTS